MRLLEIDKGLYVNLDSVIVIQFCAHPEDNYFNYRFGFGAVGRYTYFLESKSFKTQEDAEKWFEDYVLPLVPHYAFLNGEFKLDKVSMKLRKEVKNG